MWTFLAKLAKKLLSLLIKNKKSRDFLIALVIGLIFLLLLPFIIIGEIAAVFTG